MKKLINTRPIVFAALCLSLGIVIGYLSFTSRAWHFVTPILVIACVYCAAKFYKKDFNKLVLALVCLMAYLIGTLLIFAKINTYLSAKSFDGNLYTVTGVVCSVDRLGGDLIGLTLNNIKLGYKSVKYHIYVITSVQNIKVGDSILTSVRLTFSALDSKSLAQFTPLSTYAGDVMVTGENVDAFYKLFNLIKSKILSNLDGDNGAMALALLLGDTSYLTQGAKAAYKLSGVSHIFSVSGLHVVFFSTMVGALLRLVKVKGGYFVVLSFVITLCYAGVCGFPVPAIRAVIMTLILNFAKAFGRKNDSLNSIFLSLIVVLIIYPHNLFSYGLILSYFAVIGMTVYNHSFKKMFDSLPEFLQNSLATSLAVTVMITPILFKMLGYMSIIVVILNVIVVPAVNILFFILCFTTLITLVIPVFDFVWYLPNAITKLLNAFMTAIDFSRLIFYGTVTLAGLIIYYAALLFTFDQVNLKKGVKLSCGAFALITICFSLGGLF